MKTVTVAERLLEIKPQSNIELNRFEEQLKIAERLGMKGVVWALKMRRKYSRLKALNFPTTDREEISKLLNIKEDKEVLGETAFRLDYGHEEYAGLMPYGALLTVEDLVKNDVCEIGDFRIFYPQILPVRKDPVLCIEYPEMDKIAMTHLRDGGIRQADELVLFKLWQWE